MKLSDLIQKLTELERLGHGDKTVYYRRSSSGDCGELHYPMVSDKEEEAGPFDENGPWIEISAGH